MDHYFNTNKLMGSDLVKANIRNISQEEKILEFFKQNKHLVTNFSPFDIQVFLFDNKIPITSVRRGLTNLTQAGRLIKTDIMAKGPYGSPCHTWRLNK